VTPLRWLAFAEGDGASWGMAWIRDEPGRGHAALGTAGGSRVVEAAIEAGPGDAWRLHGDGLELAVSSTGEPFGGDPESRPDGFAQLALAQGSFTLEGAERAVEAHGWRATLRELPAEDRLDSLRLLAAWFGDDEALALLAVRPRKARGQEGDLVTAALVESGEPRVVADPRLSTTYGGQGVPDRAGVELWVSEPTEEPGKAGEHPHRVAGEAAGPRVPWTEGDLNLGAQPFRWHSHGRDGAGVYLLGRS
jgi:hypothetical protein